MPEQFRHLDRRRRARRADDHREQVAPRPGVRCRAVGFAGQHQLLPQPFRVLPGELAGQVVQAAHAFDRDQERLVGVQAGGDELVDGTPEVVLELVGVGLPQLPAALHVVPPLGELGLQLVLPSALSCAALQAGSRSTAGVAGAAPDLLERVDDRVPLAALLGELGQAAAVMR